jgi:hypothetical protein
MICSEKISALFLTASLASFASFASGGCGGTTTGNPTVDASASEIAESSLSGAVNSTEPNGTQAFYTPAPARGALAEVLDALSPIHSSYASSSCPTIRTATCSGGTFTMLYSDCNFSGSLTSWNGSQTLVFSGGTCPTVSLGGLANKILTRNFGAGTTETTVLGVKTVLDTTAASASGWDSSVSVSEGETATFTGAGDGSRSLQILGLHLHATTSGGTVLYDHTVSSTAATVTGAGLGRTISGGTVTVQHNLAKYTAQAQITTPLSYSVASCCHPGSGMITTTLTGGVTGTETLTFTGGSTSSCGTATFVSSAGVTSNITLSHCF